ncbi:hypothetical protein HPB51_017913 [Rhipicephalus microplus]|uniref:Uncharacterized protein n=1 Tax=Rhipicephalus microplus TaxID=6941 RepID=A0A9J6F5K8_RHIMP|nr:hypothetical protein HPB51_017913 [Rhipicephalus microplus]
MERAPKRRIQCHLRAHDHKHEHSCEAEVNVFFEELGTGSPSDVKDAAEGGDDVEHERSSDTEVSLHRYASPLHMRAWPTADKA